MGEWQALRPTVSLRCHSTDIAKHFGPGTSRRCRARVLYRRGRGCFAGVPASCAIGVPAGFAAGVPGAVGPARPLAVRAASVARRVVSRPGQALPPSTDTAAVPSEPSGALHTSGACGADVVSCVAAMPCRRPRTPRPCLPGPLRTFWNRGGCESMSGCDRASQTHTEAPGAVAPGAPAAIRCDLSEPNATRSVAA